MSNGATTPWNVLSGMISKKVSGMRERKQKQEDEIFKSKLDTLTAGIKGRMEAGETVTQEEVDREYGELAKGAPKEAQPLIVQAGKALWQVMSHKRRAGQQGQQGAGKPGQPLSKSPATDAQADAGASASGE